MLSRRMRPRVWRLSGLVAALLAWAPVAAPAAEPATRPTSRAAATTRPAATRPAVPAVVKPDPVLTPRTLKDLQTLEKLVQKVTAKAIPATVGIRMRMGQGSGVIISADGYVMTAGHVIGAPDQDCSIILPDGRTVKGRSLGVNHGIDSGLIKITTPGVYPHVPLGKAEALKMGQWCVSLGHPNGYRRDRPPVVRTGRVLLNTSSVIMTDCTLVGGDSGGPLFDLEGRLIGIHSRIGTPTMVNMHVPVDTYVATWDRLVAAEMWGSRGFGRGGGPRGGPGGGNAGAPAVLGVMGVDDDRGCRIESVVEGSPAAKAGLMAGDVIVRFERRTVRDLEGLRGLIGRRRPGDEVEVVVIRAGDELTLRAKLAAP